MESARVDTRELGSETSADPRSGNASGERILAAAMHRFAQVGYEAVRVEDVAADVGLAKGSVFFHFGSKRGLFLAAYRRAARSLPGYLDAPDDVVAGGVFAVSRHWLAMTEHLIRDAWVPYRLAILGTYSTNSELRGAVDRFLAEEDSFGTVALVERGRARGELRADVDLDMTVALVDWLMDRFQDALVTEELSRGLFPRHGAFAARHQRQIDQFMCLLEDAIGASSGRSRARGQLRAPAARARGAPER